MNRSDCRKKKSRLILVFKAEKHEDHFRLQQVKLFNSSREFNFFKLRHQ